MTTDIIKYRNISSVTIKALIFPLICDKDKQIMYFIVYDLVQIKKYNIF